jgi:hypothetical protein
MRRRSRLGLTRWRRHPFAVEVVDSAAVVAEVVVAAAAPQAQRR